jgi:hypothetical protein
MSGYHFAGSRSAKSCVVVAAHVQGFTQNLATFRKTEAMQSNRKPFFIGKEPQ